jgi:hypothetical protein
MSTIVPYWSNASALISRFRTSRIAVMSSSVRVGDAAYGAVPECLDPSRT